MVLVSVGQLTRDVVQESTNGWVVNTRTIRRPNLFLAQSSCFKVDLNIYLDVCPRNKEQCTFYIFLFVCCFTLRSGVVILNFFVLFFDSEIKTLREHSKINFI